MQIPPKGTRGARMPSGRMLRFGTGFMARLYRASGGRIGGHRTLLLTTVGAKSVSAKSPRSDGSRMARANGSSSGRKGGAAEHPAWVFNLVRNPDQVGQRSTGNVQVTPEVLAGEERTTAWCRIVAEAPQFGGYETKTDLRSPLSG